MRAVFSFFRECFFPDYSKGLAPNDPDYTFFWTCQELRIHECKLNQARRKGFPLTFERYGKQFGKGATVADQWAAINCTDEEFKVFMWEYWGRRGQEYYEFRKADQQRIDANQYDGTETINHSKEEFTYA